MDRCTKIKEISPDATVLLEDGRTFHAEQDAAGAYVPAAGCRIYLKRGQRVRHADERGSRATYIERPVTVD